MKADRRSFLCAAAGAGMAALPAAAAPTPAVQARYDKLDAILQQPVLKRQYFSTPVIIESVELLHLDGAYLCRVRSKDGAEGISVAHSSMNTLFPIFLRNVAPFFLGKDARELDLILEKIFIFGFNFRLSGLALGLPLATVEFAILEMLGRMAKRPVGELIGEIHNREVGVYMATEWREKPVEESLKLIQGAVAEHDIHALKIKIGGLMFMTTDMYAVGPPGRTEKIVPLVRKTFGDKMALYADSNSFYTVPEAIRVGKLLEEYKFVYFEEPVKFDHIEEIKQVADALTIPIANGEQDFDYYGFRWLMANDGLDIVQPDNYYFGGLIRSMKVARMAAACGRTIVPHMSGGGLGFLYDIQFVSAAPNAGEHHEFKSFKTHVKYECKTAPMKVVNGKIKVPTAPGFGADLDPDWVKKHEPVRL
ncbi:mandelate racemase/muconate lactonizing enzyme family protein [Paludibaculum fermentans]|uniref:mandelate racemase/muconate lactonizing enzyme family protein n=1 Tax=Paludibaculum fermentans TaxID=1473598 RepID=UPI003EBD8085